MDVGELYRGARRGLAGLQAGAVLIAIDGKPLNLPDELTKVNRALKPGQTILGCSLQRRIQKARERSDRRGIFDLF